MSRGFGLKAVLFSTVIAVLASSAAMGQDSVTILRESDPSNYDPHRSAARPTNDVGLMAGDTLVAIDYDLKTVVPGLAKSWEISPDGLTYTFHLRDDVTFCSGKKLTAADVVSNYERWLNPETKGTSLWKMGAIDKITAKDNYTVEYHLKRPFSELLYHMSTGQHIIINTEQAKQLGADFGIRGMDATGPYCFERWNPRVETVLRKHEGYNWGPKIGNDPVSPQVGRVIWKVVPEENTRVTSLQVGQDDLAAQIPYWSVAEFLNNKQITTALSDVYLNVVFFGFKAGREIPKDPTLRKAIDLAIGRKNLTDAITFGVADPAYTFVAPQATDFDKSLPLSEPADGAAQARKILDEAGWKVGSDGFRYKDGKKLSLTLYSFNGYWKEIAEAAQGDLRSVGIELVIQLFDATVAWSKLATNEYDLFLISTAYMTAGDLIGSWFPADGKRLPSTDHVDPQLVADIQKGAEALDPAVRAQAYAAAQKRINDSHVMIPIYHEKRYIVVGKRLKPFKGHGVSGSALYKGLPIAFR
jgi:peptide/nickel transport system substrate-binding protein